jgi:predicted anti-sigma-YlaC factor YlaD
MSTQCKAICDQLSAYRDGELDARRQAMVREHLAACPACRREYAQLQQMLGTLPAWETPAVSPALSSILLDRLATREARAPWWRTLVSGWGRVAIPVGVAAVLLLAVLVISDHPTSHHDIVRVSRPPHLSEVRMTENRVDMKTKGDATSSKPAGNDVAYDRVEVGKRAASHGKGDMLPPSTPTPDPATVAVALMAETPLPPSIVTPAVSKCPDEVAIDCLTETR